MKFNIDYSGLPKSLREGARLWIEEGIGPGSFLRAVIDNNLLEACCQASRENLEHIVDITKWWYIEAPAHCWGTKGKADEWAKARAKERRLKSA